MFIAELLLTMPLFMILLMAVIQFGVYFANAQMIPLASRVGAEAAAETLNLGATVAAVEQHLQSAGLDYCRVRLQHNVGLVYDASSPGGSGCDCGEVDPDGTLPDHVRVTVCVQLSELMPNLLSLVGFDVSDPTRLVSSTTVMRYEGP